MTYDTLDFLSQAITEAIKNDERYQMLRQTATLDINISMGDVRIQDIQSIEALEETNEELQSRLCSIQEDYDDLKQAVNDAIEELSEIRYALMRDGHNTKASSAEKLNSIIIHLKVNL